MRTFKPLQPKHLLTSAPRTLTSRLLQSSRSLMPVSAPVPELAPPVTQAQLERAAHFEHCFAHVPVFPPSVFVQRQEADGKPMQKRSASELMEEDAARDEEVAPTALTSHLLQSPRPLTPVSAPEAAFPVTQAKRERVSHLGHSFAQLFQASAPRSAVSPSASSLSGLLQNEVPLQRTAEPRPNTTGLPDTLKAGVEDLSGLSLDDVHVHYHSSKPAEIQAFAYTQGSDIHVGPGQERYLAHEAWHVVQQAQGRVQPTTQVKDVAVNDDIGLEQEASEMGDKANLGVTKDKIILNLQEENQELTSLEVDTTKKGLGNRRTFQKKNGFVTQMVTMYQAGNAAELSWGGVIFDQRVADKTATTGAHNYALNVYTSAIKRSTTSGHAEMLLLALSSAEKGGEVLLISEYKPCKSCQKQFEEIEQVRGFRIRVIYFLEYENKGDGDTEITRNFYKEQGFLEGGGDYTYGVTKSVLGHTPWPNE